MAMYQRLRDLREDADKTQIEIANYLGTTAQYYGKYEKGERELPFSRAILLAEYYNVSLDYLAGRSPVTQGNPLTDEEKALVESWRQLSEREKGKVEYHIEEILETRGRPANTQKRSVPGIPPRDLTKIKK